MLIDKRISKPSETCSRVRRGHKLIRIGAAFVAHSHRFAAPDELRSASPESLPSAKCMVAGIAVARSVPSFHRLHRETIANFDAIANKRLRQRRLCTAEEFVVAGDRQAKRIEMLSKVSDISNCSQTQNFGHLRNAPSRGRASLFWARGILKTLITFLR